MITLQTHHIEILKRSLEKLEQGLTGSLDQSAYSERLKPHQRQLVVINHVTNNVTATAPAVASDGQRIVANAAALSEAAVVEKSRDRQSRSTTDSAARYDVDRKLAAVALSNESLPVSKPTPRPAIARSGPARVHEKTTAYFQNLPWTASKDVAQPALDGDATRISVAAAPQPATASPEQATTTDNVLVAGAMQAIRSAEQAPPAPGVSCKSFFSGLPWDSAGTSHGQA